MSTAKDLSGMRRDYLLGKLDESTLPTAPFTLFAAWMQDAVDRIEQDPTAMILSTATAEGIPSSRVVLLKEASEKGFSFFTNYESRKGRELFVNPSAALLFFWPGLERQVRIEGETEKLSEEESGAYFAQRPTESRLAAWASPQSKTIPDRNTLETRLERSRQRFEGQDIPRPAHWGGYILVPHRIEFWQGRPARLHDRILYAREGSSWKITRLAP